MQLSPSDTILRMFSYGQTILSDLVDFVYALFTTTLREYLLFLSPVLGPVYETIIEKVLKIPIFDFNMLEIFLFSIPVFICLTVVKWIIDLFPFV